MWLLDLEGMKLLKVIETSVPSSMLLTADGKQRLVSHDTQVVETFDTGTFAKISTVKNTGTSPVDAFFPPGSYFLPNGRFIVSGVGYFRIRVKGGQFRQEVVDPRTQLSAENLERLSEFVETQKDGQKLLLAVPVSSRSGKTSRVCSQREKDERSLLGRGHGNRRDLYSGGHKLSCAASVDRLGE